MKICRNDLTKTFGCSIALFITKIQRLPGRSKSGGAKLYFYITSDFLLNSILDSLQIKVFVNDFPEKNVSEHPDRVQTISKFSRQTDCTEILAGKEL